MKTKSMRTFILAAAAVGLVVATMPAPAQVFAPTRPDSKGSPKTTTPQ